MVTAGRALEFGVISRCEGRREEQAHPTPHPMQSDRPPTGRVRHVESEAPVERNRGIQVTHLEYDHGELNFHSPTMHPSAKFGPGGGPACPRGQRRIRPEADPFADGTRGGRLLNRRVPLWGWAFVGMTFREIAVRAVSARERPRVAAALPLGP